MHTMRRISIDCIWTNYVVRPFVATALYFSEIVLLIVVEVVTLIIIAGETLLQRDFHRTKMDAIILILWY